MRNKKTEVSEKINELFIKRWSTRAFDINKQVDKDKLISICEAGRLAPTCFNDQPYKFIIWDKYENEEEYNKAFDCLGEWNQNWAKTAPVLIVAIANSKFKNNGKFNRWSQYDTGSATMCMIIQATSMDIYSHAMGGFDENKLKSVFNISDDFVPMAMIAFGYQADNIDIIDSTYHHDETKKRERLSLETNFYFSEWKN